MQFVGVLRVAVDLGDRLDPGGDEDVALARPDRVVRHSNRLERRGAEPVDGRSRDRGRQPGEKGGAPPQVHALLLLREPATDHHVDHFGAVELGDLLQGRVDRERD
jgi:hypothetical protein